MRKLIFGDKGRATIVRNVAQREEVRAIAMSFRERELRSGLCVQYMFQNFCSPTQHIL